MSYVKYIFIYGFIALAGVPISVLLAKSTLVGGAFGKISGVFLVILLFAGGLSIHQYLFIKGLGATDTIFAPVLYYIFPVANSLVLAIIISINTQADKNNFQKEFKVWKPAFVLGLLQFINMWNSDYVPFVLYSGRPDIPPLYATRMPVDYTACLVFLHNFDLYISILPIGLFLIFRRYITEWILLAFTRTSCN